MKARRLAQCILVLGMCLFAAANACADEGEAAAGRSFLQVLREGSEWPGKIIGLLSLVSITIVAEQFWSVRRSTIVPDGEVENVRQLIEARKYKECLEVVRGGKTMFADILAVALRHGRHGFEAMREAADQRASAWSSRLFRRVEYLNIIGNLGPLMGLLGTVLGMIRAFGEMQQAHGAYKPENLAGGISLALVNTFLGLAVAIVSLGLFGVCRNRVDALTVMAHAAAMDLLEYFRPVVGSVEPVRTDGGAPTRPPVARAGSVEAAP